MTTIQQITQYLEKIAPLSSQENYDNCGLLVGNYSDEVINVLVTLDCTEEVVQEAMDRKCNLIVAHHPIIFGGLKKINGKNYVERAILKAIKNDIAIYAIHTNLDNSIHGVNHEIAERLKLINTKILQPKSNVLTKLIFYTPVSHANQVKEAIFLAGAGTIGNYDECSFSTLGKGTYRPLTGSHPFEGNTGSRSEVEEERIEVLVSNHQLNKVVAVMKEVHPYEEVAYDLIALQNNHSFEGAGMIGELENAVSEIDFLKTIKTTFNCGTIRYTKLQNKSIKKVAVCGGSGSFLLKDAIQKKADIYITADMKYHEFFDAENQILIADIGHYESEQFTSDLIVAKLKEKFINFAVLKTGINTNPIKYL